MEKESLLIKKPHNSPECLFNSTFFFFPEQAGEKHYHPTCARCVRCCQMFAEGEEMYLQGKTNKQSSNTWHPGPLAYTCFHELYCVYSHFITTKGSEV